MASIMLRKSIPRIIHKKCRSLSLFVPNSAFAIAKSTPTCFRLFARTSVNTQNNQSALQFSTTPGLSVQTETMDGAGDHKVLQTDYDELLKAQEVGVLIIDVREQNEINETGKLPGSIHIPMGDVTNLLTTMSDEAFKNKFQKSKPDKDTKIILSCRSGMRSGKVQEAMRKLGYEKVYNYNGGWLDWESRQKV